MNLFKIATQAKTAFDKAGGSKKVQEAADKAKAEFEKRGGAEGLKASAKNVADATKGKGSVADKAKAAAEAAKVEAKKTEAPAAPAKQ